MRFFFDANISKYCSRSLAVMHEDVVHIDDYPSLPPDASDELILSHIGPAGYFLITQDNRIRYKPNERKLIRQHKIGAFIIWGSQAPEWEIFRQLVWQWQIIKDLAARSKKPFIKKVRRRGEKIIDLNY